LSKLFNVEGWDPKRVRKPRTPEEESLCISEDKYEKLLGDPSKGQLLYESPPDNPNQLRIYENWSFFLVRIAKQCLEHTKAAKDANVPLRIEVFAPVLLEMLRASPLLKDAFVLNPSNLLILLLNPTSVSVRAMQEPPEELKQATLVSVTERYRVQGKAIDLADGLRRVDYLVEELEAWKGFAEFLPGNTLECLRWPHFEFCYGPPGNTAQARAELLKARKALLDAIGRQWPLHAHDLSTRLGHIMRTETEIQALTNIV
jgi:hypothetical protein